MGLGVAAENGGGNRCCGGFGRVLNDLLFLRPVAWGDFRCLFYIFYGICVIEWCGGVGVEKSKGLDVAAGNVAEIYVKKYLTDV